MACQEEAAVSQHLAVHNQPLPRLGHLVAVLVAWGDLDKGSVGRNGNVEAGQCPRTGGAVSSGSGRTASCRGMTSASLVCCVLVPLPFKSGPRWEAKARSKHTVRQAGVTQAFAALSLMVATGVSHVLVPLNRDLSPAVHFMQDMRDDVMSVTPDGRSLPRECLVNSVLAAAAIE